MLLKFLIFSFVFYLVIRLVSRVFLITSGSSPGKTRRKGGFYHNSASSDRSDHRTRNRLDEVEEAEFEDITEKQKKDS